MSHRASAEQLDRYRRRSAAAEFLRVHRVPEQLETVLDQVFLQRPADLHGFLAEHFLKLSAPPRISSLRGTQVYDATGQLSVQAEVFCVLCNKEKRTSWAAVAHQETSLERTRADHVTTAVQWINGPLNDLLLGQNPCNQSEVDQKLRDFFTARYVEEKNLRDMENVENRSPKEPDMEVPSPPSTQRKGKKSADGGKQTNPSEKPVPPAEPAEAVLCGSAAIGSLSVAVLKTGAAVKNIPLYRHTAALKNAVLRQPPPGLKPPAHHQTQTQTQTQTQVPVPVPVCLVPLLRGGRTSPGRRSLLKELILIPSAGRAVRQIVTVTLQLQKEVMRIMNTSTKAGANQTIVCDAGVPVLSVDRPEQLLDVVAEACSNLGLVLGTQVHLALDCAAPELLDYSKGKYEVSPGVLKSPDELVDVYHTLLSRYPAVVSLIDPFRREDSDQWDKLNKKTGTRCSLISDLTYKLQAPPPPGARGFILKHTNQTTVSDLIHIASEQQGSVLMGTTSSEPCTDDSWSDIAVGLGLDYVKLGGLSGAERISKYNRLVSIEEELAAEGILVTRDRLPPPLFPEDPDEQLVPVEPNVCDGEQNPVCST